MLEGQLDLPDEGAATPTAGVVICHPHPQYGGEMTNNVVMAVSSSIVAFGMAALRFNFRGAGRSGGAYDNGIGEQDDALAALQALATGTVADELPDEMRVGLAGYSFGGGVALGAARGAVGLAALALISPAIGDDASQEALSALTMPKLIATGEADNFCDSGTRAGAGRDAAGRDGDLHRAADGPFLVGRGNEPRPARG